MKLDSKYLKSLILEVIDEATRRDFLKGAAGLVGTAAIGGTLASLYDDEEEQAQSIKDKYKDAPVLTREKAIEMGMHPKSVDELFGPEGEEKEQIPLENPEDAWKESKPQFSKSQGKAALNTLRVTPTNLEFYGVAPAQGSAGEAYAYVDLGALYDMADEDPKIAEALVTMEGFYSDFSLKEHFRYVFGSLAFWGTFKDDDPNNMQLAPIIKGENRYGQPVNINILPLAWSASLDYWTTRFESLEARLQQYPDKRKEILLEAGLSEQEYKQMKAGYINVINRMSDGAVVPNPDYEPTEKQ